jgi:hypothetical protein
MEEEKELPKIKYNVTDAVTRVVDKDGNEIEQDSNQLPVTSDQ